MIADQGWPGSETPLAVPARWELGDEFTLVTSAGWARKVRVVRVTDTGPYTREYALREIDDGHHVFQSEADEEEFDPHRLVWAHAVQQGVEGHIDAQGRHEDRQQVAGGSDGAEGFEQDLARSGGEAGREAADGEGFDGAVGEGRLRDEQAGVVQGDVGARQERPVLGLCPGSFKAGTKVVGTNMRRCVGCGFVGVESVGGGFPPIHEVAVRGAVDVAGSVLLGDGRCAGSVGGEAGVD